MLKTSTGLRTAMLGTASARTALNLGKINIYSGAVPATADAAVTGTLLCTITNNSTATGITLDTAVAGSIPKTAAEVWSGVNVATATASYYRHVGASDTGALSTTEPRVQGLIATSGAELNLTSVALSSGATQTIDFYSITLPTL